MKQSEIIERIADAFGQNDRRIFARNLPSFRIEEFRREKHIEYQDDLADAARLVVAGMAELSKWRLDGSRLLVRTVEPGEWIGLAETVAAGPYLSDACAAPDCYTATFGVSATRDLVSRFPENMSQFLAREYYRLHKHLSLSSARDRVVQFLLTNKNNESQITVTQEEIAHRLSLSRETVNRTLKELENRGSLETGRGKITILRPLNNYGRK